MATINRAQTQYVADVGSDLFIRDVSRFPELIKRTDYPLYTMIKTGEPLKQPKLKLEWGVRFLDPINDTITEVIANEAGPSTVTPANIGYYMVGHVIQLSSGEQIRVTAVGASTFTATRGFAGTTISNEADNAGIRIIGIAVAENAESPLGPITRGELDYNYFQIWDEMLQYSQRAQVTPNYETDGDQLQMEVNKKLKTTMPQHMESTLRHGVRSIGNSTGTPSSMGGVFQPSFNTSNVDMAGDILTEYQFLEGLQLAYNQVGASNVGKTVMSHPFYKRIAGNWTRDMVRLTDDSKKRNLGVVDEYMTDFGTVRWVMNHHWTDVNDPTLPDGKILVFDPDDYTIRPYSSATKWGVWAIYEGGWYKRRAIRGDYTLEAINPEKRVAFDDLSKVALDYPNFVNP